MKLKDKSIAHLSKPGRYTDSVGGLHLWIKSPSKKYWIMRFTHQGKRHDHSLGAYPNLSLKEARSKAVKLADKLSQNVTPFEVKRQQEIAIKAQEKRDPTIQRLRGTNMPLILTKFCGAHARTTGNLCLGRPMKNGRCKLHGGKSAGATSPEGKKKVADATRKRMLAGQQKLALEGYKRWLENGGRHYLSESQKMRWKLKKWLLGGYKPWYKYDRYLPKFKEFKRYLERQSKG